MQIQSPAFANNTNIPAKYTCDGGDVNPELHISEVPEGTKSLALIMDDPDAPSGMFVHWVMWNISPQATVISENSVPAGAQQGQSNFQRANYGGPCPHVGTHHYHFKLYALDQMFNLSAQTDKAALERAMEGHILARAELVGLYNRSWSKEI